MAHLRPIDKEFEEADDTGVLVLSSRNLRNFPVVPGDLCDFNDLLEADFTNNRFDHVPQEVCDFRQLVKLSFYRNLLRSVPEDLKHLENLKDLNLSRNLLPTIPVGLCQMNLHSLNLSNNRLVSLPLPLGHLKQLRYLNLSCNHLPDLPSTIVDLSSLQHLDLHRNQLRELPAEIHALSLRYLDISCNQITALPTTLRHIADTLQIFKMTDNPIESPPTHVCVRGLMHIVKWMEGLEKHGSDPHLLSISSSRDASLARRKGKRHSTTSRSFIDNSQAGAGENGVLNLDEVTNRINSSLRAVESPSLLAKNDGEITPTHTSTPMHWSVAQYRNTPGSAMSDQSKEEYREAAHKLYMQQERQKNRINRRKRSSSPIQATAKAAVALSKQQSGSTELNSIPTQRGSKEDIVAAQSAPSPTGGTKSLGGSPRVAPATMRSLPGEKVPRPGSWNSHTKVSSSPILPSKYALPASEKQTSEDEGSSASSKGGGDSEDETQKKKGPPPPTPQNKPDPVTVRRNATAEGNRNRAVVEETHKKPPPVEAVGATPTSSRETQQQHLGSELHRRERSPVPHFDRSDSVTPTNELIDEESLTPRSKEGKDTGHTLAAASQKLQEELSSVKESGSVREGGQTTAAADSTAPNGVAGGGTKMAEVKRKKPVVGEEGKKKPAAVVVEEGKKKPAAVVIEEGKKKPVVGEEGRKKPAVMEKKKKPVVVGEEGKKKSAVEEGKRRRPVVVEEGKRRRPVVGEEERRKSAVVGEEGRRKKEDWRQSLQEGDMIQNLDSSPKARRTLSSESDSSDGGEKKDATWPRALPPRKKKEKDVFKFLKEDNSSNYTVRRQEFQISRVMEKSRIVREKIEELLDMELSEDIGEWVADGVVLCRLVKKLQPQLMPSFHAPSQGKDLSRGRKTVNIANFIAACRQLHVPEEELCSAGDIIELKDPVRVITCLQRVLESAGILVMSP